jgi:hypothetical protein
MRLQQEVASMAEDEQRRQGWRERRKEAKRAKAERTGESPERIADRKRRGREDPPTPGENAERAGLGGVFGG